jgi:hypothetical protein
MIWRRCGVEVEAPWCNHPRLACYAERLLSVFVERQVHFDSSPSPSYSTAPVFCRRLFPFQSPCHLCRPGNRNINEIVGFFLQYPPRSVDPAKRYSSHHNELEGVLPRFKLGMYVKSLPDRCMDFIRSPSVKGSCI